MRTRSRRPARFVRWLCMSLLAVVLGGCPVVDSRLYTEGDVGIAELENPFQSLTLWLGGCTAFVQEEWVEGEWVGRGGEFDCFWEGFAQPVAPKETREDKFVARDPGKWRLAYDVGFGCSADAPLSTDACRRVMRVPSRPFEVVAIDDEALCTGTGGTWDPLSCGHYPCGFVPECEAIIPGCDCGPGSTFVDGVGCQVDASCQDGEQALCESTGGVWDPLSCGHWQCGQPPICAAVIPGCNCGPFSLFVEEEGCLAAPCGAPR